MLGLCLFKRGHAYCFFRSSSVCQISISRCLWRHPTVMLLAFTIWKHTGRRTRGPPIENSFENNAEWLFLIFLMRLIDAYRVKKFSALNGTQMLIYIFSQSGVTGSYPEALEFRLQTTPSCLFYLTFLEVSQTIYSFKFSAENSVCTSHFPSAW
jgi:hypothetical protein